MPMDKIPETHRDLIDGASWAALTAVMPDGQPHSTLRSADCDDQCVLINTTLQRNRRVSLLVVDPANTSRWIEIRGRVVETVVQGAETHADALARRYWGDGSSIFTVACFRSKRGARRRA